MLTAFACDKKSEEPAKPTPPAATPSAPAPQPSKAEAVPASTPTATQSAAPVNPALLKPEAAKEKAPEKFKVKFTTTKGDFVVEATRAWAPIGADRFYNLVKLGFFTDIGFFRVVPDFVVQFGIHGNPEVAAAWRTAQLQDDPTSKQSNEKGTLTFAKGGPNSRTTQMFINYKNNDRLDKMGFPPFAKVISGTEVIDAINKEYGEQPQQPTVQSEGNAYLKREFPRLDYIKSATIVTK
ncbi:MAG: peptidylprolyl isomerase [Deltaproteobacteria bacterium]|nr:peptidylprolyl isomerase [Deltaproteobacteria bacterium]